MCGTRFVFFKGDVLVGGHVPRGAVGLAAAAPGGNINVCVATAMGVRGKKQRAGCDVTWCLHWVVSGLGFPRVSRKTTLIPGRRAAAACVKDGDCESRCRPEHVQPVCAVRCASIAGQSRTFQPS